MKNKILSKKYTMGPNELKMAEQFPNFNFNSLFNSNNLFNSNSNSNSSNSRTRQTLKNLKNPNYEGPWSGIHPTFKERLIQKYMNKPINHINNNNNYSQSIKDGIIKGIKEFKKKNKSPKTKKSSPKTKKSPPKTKKSTKKSTKKPLTKSQILERQLRVLRNMDYK